MTPNVLPLPQTKSPIWEKDEKDPFLYLHLPTGMFYVRAKRKGKKPLFKKTGYTTKGKAKTKAIILLAEWMGTRRPQDHNVILFGEFAEEFLIHLQKTKLRPRTKEQAKIYINKLIEEMGMTALVHINEGFFEEWLADFRQRTDRTTFCDFAKYLSKTLRHAHRKGLIDRLPQIKNPDPPKRSGRVYTHDEIKKLIDHSDTRLELQLRLSLQAFMRLREVLFLTWKRVDLETGQICLGADDVKTGSKTGEGREFFVNEDIKTLLRIQRTKGPQWSEYVFPSPKDGNKPTWSNKTAWKKLKKKAGLTGRARWHDLRHTALTWALTEKKMNPLLVSAYAGVSIRTIQKVYLHIRPEHTAEVADCIEV